MNAVTSAHAVQADYGRFAPAFAPAGSPRKAAPHRPLGWARLRYCPDGPRRSPQPSTRMEGMSA
jgi:hypothetical protein